MSSNFKAREKLYHAKKKPEESIKKWISRLEHLAEDCGFDQQRQGGVLRDIFVIGLSGPIKNKLFKEIDKNNRIAISKLHELALQDEYVQLGVGKPKKKIVVEVDEDDDRYEVSIQCRRQGVSKTKPKPKPKPKPKATATTTTSYNPYTELSMPVQMGGPSGYPPPYSFNPY